MQSVPITTNVVCLNPAQAGCTHLTLCDKVCQWLVAGLWFSLGTLVSSTIKNDHHDITEILLKVALIIMTLTLIYIGHDVITWNQSRTIVYVNRSVTVLHDGQWKPICWKSVTFYFRVRIGRSIVLYGILCSLVYSDCVYFFSDILGLTFVFVSFYFLFLMLWCHYYWFW